MNWEKPRRAGRDEALALLSVTFGVILLLVGILALTVRGVEADLTQTVGTPPLWMPATLLAGLGLLGLAVPLFRRSR